MDKVKIQIELPFDVHLQLMILKKIEGKKNWTELLLPEIVELIEKSMKSKN